MSRAMRRMMGSMNQVKVCMEVPCFVSGVNGGTLYASISSNALMNRSPCGVKCTKLRSLNFLPSNMSPIF